MVINTNTTTITALLVYVVSIVVTPTWYNGCCVVQGTTNHPTRVAKGPYHVKAVRDWMNARCNKDDPSSFGTAAQKKKKKKNKRRHNDNHYNNDDHDELQIPSGSAIWIYQGGLYDPLDGRQIANVEGVELVRHLGDCYANQPRSQQRYQTRCLDLQAPQFLNTTTSSTSKEKNKEDHSWDYATTCLTRKMFCYTTPRHQEEDRQHPPPSQQQQQQRHYRHRHAPTQQLLSKIRLRPTSPQRRIPTEQAVALYDAATTFVSRFQGQELLVHTEKPDTTTFWGEAIAPYQNNRNENDNNHHNNDDDDDTLPTTPRNTDFDLTVYAKRRATNDLPSLTAQPSPQQQQLRHKHSGNGKDAIIVSPKRSKLIQFGSGNNWKGGGSFRLGARETYHYYTTTTTPTTTPPQSLSHTKKKKKKRHSSPSQVQEVRYTRYGEGPPWYGPHKMCTLELQGRRITSMTQIPSLSANLIADHIPGFLSVHTPIPYVEEWNNNDNNNDNDETETTTTTTNGRRRRRFPRFRQRQRQRPSSSSSHSYQQKDDDDVEDWNHDIELSDQAAAQSVHWFRDCHTLPLKLHHYDDDTENDDILHRTNTNNGHSTTPLFQKWWQKLEQATKVSK